MSVLNIELFKFWVVEEEVLDQDGMYLISRVRRHFEGLNLHGGCFEIIHVR